MNTNATIVTAINPPMFVDRYVRSPANDCCGAPMNVAAESEVAMIEIATAQIGIVRAAVKYSSVCECPAAAAFLLRREKYTPLATSAAKYNAITAQSATRKLDARTNVGAFAKPGSRIMPRSVAKKHQTNAHTVDKPAAQNHFSPKKNSAPCSARG